MSEYEELPEEIEQEEPEPEIVEDPSSESIPDEGQNPQSSGPVVDQNIKTTDLCLIGGKRGSGKTNLLLFLIKTLHAQKMKVIIIDTVADLKPNLPPELQKQVVFIPYGDRPKFDKFVKDVIKSGWKGMLIVDEIDGFFPNRKRLTPLENAFIQIGRHYGIGIIGASRRLSNLHTDLTTQSSKLFLFKFWNRNDIDYLKQSSLGEYAALLVGLEKYHFLYMNPDMDAVQICTPVPLQK